MPCGGGGDHLLVAVAGGRELVVGERGDDDARADGVDAGAPVSPGGCRRGTDAQLVGALGGDVGNAGVGDGVLLDKVQVSELVGGGEGELALHLVGEAHHVASLARDDEARAALGDDLAEDVDGVRGCHEVERDDCLGRGLVGGGACSVDEVLDRAELGGAAGKRLHRRAVEGVDQLGLDDVALVAKVAGRCLEVLLADVAEKDRLYDVITCDPDWGNLQRELQRQASGEHEETVPEGFLPEQWHLFYAYVSQTGLAMYRAWVADGKKAPVEEVADLAAHATEAGARALARDMGVDVGL